MATITNIDYVIPVCSSCKKLRIDGIWVDGSNFYENADTSDMSRVSHGICPECAKVLYPDYASKMTILSPTK